MAISRDSDQDPPLLLKIRPKGLYGVSFPSQGFLLCLTGYPPHQQEPQIPGQDEQKVQNALDNLTTTQTLRR